MSAVAAGTPQLIALVGNPNCGKTALFNLLTGSRQKVANYAGVTVERKEGVAIRLRQARSHPRPAGRYSLEPATPDEQVTRDVVLGPSRRRNRPDAIVCVADATNLRLNLRLVLELKRLGLPMVLALNMSDLARKRGIVIDVTRSRASSAFRSSKPSACGRRASPSCSAPRCALPASRRGATRSVRRRCGGRARSRGSPAHPRGRRRRSAASETMSDRIDARRAASGVGPADPRGVLFLMFQAVFAWATVPMDAITAGVDALAGYLRRVMPDTALRSLLVDGVLAGAGSVLVFLPQILILFFFILVLEDSGYLPRAAFLLDRLMGGVGLSGRAFIPLLSSFACAIPASWRRARSPIRATGSRRS